MLQIEADVFPCFLPLPWSPPSGLPGSSRLTGYRGGRCSRQPGRKGRWPDTPSCIGTLAAAISDRLRPAAAPPRLPGDRPPGPSSPVLPAVAALFAACRDMPLVGPPAPGAQTARRGRRVQAVWRNDGRTAATAPARPPSPRLRGPLGLRKADGAARWVPGWDRSGQGRQRSAQDWPWARPHQVEDEPNKGGSMCRRRRATRGGRLLGGLGYPGQGGRGPYNTWKPNQKPNQGPIPFCNRGLTYPRKLGVFAGISHRGSSDGANRTDCKSAIISSTLIGASSLNPLPDKA